MTPSDDLYPPRRPIFFPVVIATVFLTIIGMTIGFMLGERHQRIIATVSSPNDAGGATFTSEPTPVATGPLCPKQTQELALRLDNAAGELHQVMRVETERQTVVWICADGAGRLYYQANRGGENATWKEGVTALYLPDVVAVGDHEYLATATNQNQFRISREELRIIYKAGAKAGQVEIQRVVAY